MHPISVLDFLVSRQGYYHGSGTNEDGHPFKGELWLSAKLGGAAVELVFKAIDENSAFHEELTFITPNLLKDHLALWTMSTNTPGMLEHRLIEDSSDAAHQRLERRLVFRLGEPEQLHSFRQEIRLDVMRDGSIEYQYSWGVPHEKFASRTRTILHFVS